MDLFVKILSIWHVVNKVVTAALQAGSATPLEPLIIQESCKSLNHAVNAGHLNPSVLDDHKNIVTALVQAHPDVRLFDEPKDNVKPKR